MTLFKVGAQFPPTQKDVDRLATYEEMVGYFEGNQKAIFHRMSELLKDSPYKEQMQQLYLGCNLSDIIASKPSELLLSEPAVFESGGESDSEEQKALNRLVEENDIKQLLYEFTVGAAIRGDAFLKVFHNLRNDYSELTALGLPIPADAKTETVIETVNPSYVFPETARGSMTKFKAINIAYVEWVDSETNEKSLERPELSTSFFKRRESAIPHLVVERHLAGFILHQRFLLEQESVADVRGIAIPIYNLVKELPTGLPQDIIPTGTPTPLVFHFPYKQTDAKWRGTGAIEKIAQKLVAISDRLTQIDFVLSKNSDPILTGPELEGLGDLVRLGGSYISRTNDDPDVKYVAFDGNLDYAFKELDLLYSEVFAMAQLPSFLFGSSITSAQERGGGTSHTDGTTTKLRYAPVSALLDRLNNSLTKCLGDALYYAQVLENYANKADNGLPIGDFVSYEPTYPIIKLSNGIPANDAENTDIAVQRYINGLIDKHSAIKLLDRVDDSHADEMVKRIESEEAEKQQKIVEQQKAISDAGTAPSLQKEGEQTQTSSSEK